MNEQPTHVAVDADLYRELLKYLSGQKYSEVAGIINKLGSCNHVSIKQKEQDDKTSEEKDD